MGLATQVYSFASDTGIENGFHLGLLAQQCNARTLARPREWLIWCD